MSREIKFRQYLGGKMYFWGFGMDAEQGDFSFIGPSSGRGEPPHKCQQMQYTDIKDKNGKEIYEGDLLRVHNNENGVLQVEFINDYVGGWVLTHASTPAHISLGARKEFDIEVVGNIHENPELPKL